MNWKMVLTLFGLLSLPLGARDPQNKTLKLQGKVPVKTRVQFDLTKDGVATPMIHSNSPEYPSKRIRLKRVPASTSDEEVIVIESP